MADKFIKTKDDDTIAILQKNGFTLLSFSGGMATFINDGRINFELLKNKITFSNKLEF